MHLYVIYKARLVTFPRVMLLALVLLVFKCFHIHFYVVPCVVSLAKVTIYMVYIEPLFLHVNFKPTNHDCTI